VKKSPAPWRNRAGQDEAGSGHCYSCCRSYNYDVATSTAYCAQKRLAHAAPAMLSTVRVKTTRGKTAMGSRLAPMKIIVGLIVHAQLVETKAVSLAIRGFARGHASSSDVRVGLAAARPSVARVDASNKKM
jgi:hypothetical protein